MARVIPSRPTAALRRFRGLPPIAQASNLRDVSADPSRLAEFWHMTEAAGRGRLPVTVYGSRIDPALVDSYQNAGVSRCVFRLPAAGTDEVLAELDRAANLARQFTTAGAT